ncbi:MAG TPA: sulfotransferase [Steroidobacteraceae bacterium]|nr:sulfotransferase [Steroidobacteraceae bacterium]
MIDFAVSTSNDAVQQLNARQLADALAYAERAVAQARVCCPEHALLASVLLKLGRQADAEGVLANAMELETGAADAYDGLAFVSMMLGANDRANLLYRRAIAIAPGDSRFWYNLACSERSLGRLAEAEAACDRAIALDAAHYPSYLLRSELRVQAPDANHIDSLQDLLARRPDDYRARLFLGYALAKELDDVERFDEAFHWFATAARTRRERLNYDVAADERKLSRIAEVYDRRLLEAPAPQDAARASARYVFIIGLPRSGTTLLERILTGLPGVRSNGETDNFSRALLGAATGDGDVFARAARGDPAAVAREYSRLALSDPSVARIVEKLPLNYLYVGAIHRALSDAAILLVRRSPLDSCFAMFRTLFAAGYPFSYDLKDLGRYYAAYDRLIGHWRGLLGSRVQQVAYEELVRDPQAVGARIAAHCGIAWDDAAIDIERNTAASWTASAAQVRRPIYGSSSGRWRRYGAHLEPLITELRRQSIPLPD